MRSQKSFQNGYCPFQSLHPQNGGNCGIIARGSFLSYNGTPHCEPLKCDILSFLDAITTESISDGEDCANIISISSASAVSTFSHVKCQMSNVKCCEISVDVIYCDIMMLYYNQIV